MTTRRSLKQERVALTQRASAKSLNTSLADGAKLPTIINRRRSNKDKAKAVPAQLLKTISHVFFCIFVRSASGPEKILRWTTCMF